MIPQISQILRMLVAGECTEDRALGWINQHMENADLRDHFAGLAMQSVLDGSTSALTRFTQH